MKTNKTLKNIILAVGILILSTVSVHAGFGVSPTDISYENLKPGATFTKSFTLSRSGDLEEMDINVQPDLKDIDSWFTYNPGRTFKFPAGENTVNFEITVNVPNNIPYDTYEGVIRLIAVPSSQAVRGVTITQGVRLDAGLVVTEKNVTILNIQSITVLDSELNQPIQFEVVGENQGNVDASPIALIKIMDLQMNILEEHEVTNLGSIKPNETTTLTGEFDTNLPSGEYFIEIDIQLDGESLRKERLVFNINNIPEEQTDKGSDEQKEKTGTFMLSVGEFFRNNRVYLLYLLIAIVIEIIVFMILQKIWEKRWRKLQDKQKTEEVVPLLLGSTKTTRATLSLAVGFIVFLSLLLYPLLTMERKPAKELEIAMGDVQGIQKIATTPGGGVLLHVLPYKSPNEGYIVYETNSLDSDILYTAKDGEELIVIDEVQDWYKVEIEDNLIGWLRKTSVKSINTSEN
jgi:hypothetical protein